jgi:hypothetical protein
MSYSKGLIQENSVTTYPVHVSNKVEQSEYLVINKDAYLELHEEVIKMLDLFRNKLENAAINEAFKRIEQFKEKTLKITLFHF